MYVCIYIYKDFYSVIEVTSRFVLRHCQKRWLSWNRVLVRIVEYIQNLNEYFMVKLPTLPVFKSKDDIQHTESYQRNRKA